jgi:rRNA maturation protein Nop10
MQLCTRTDAERRVNEPQKSSNDTMHRQQRRTNKKGLHQTPNRHYH